MFSTNKKIDKMKLKYIFPLLIAMLAFMASCDEDEKATYDDDT